MYSVTVQNSSSSMYLKQHEHMLQNFTTQLGAKYKYKTSQFQH